MTYDFWNAFPNWILFIIACLPWAIMMAWIWAAIRKYGSFWNGSQNKFTLTLATLFVAALVFSFSIEMAQEYIPEYHPLRYYFLDHLLLSVCLAVRDSCNILCGNSEEIFNQIGKIRFPVPHYSIIIYALSILLPILTVAYLLSTISTMREIFFIRYYRNEVFYVFSDINAQSISMAYSIYDERRKQGSNSNCFLFLRCSKRREELDPDLVEKLKDITFVIFPGNEVDILRTIPKLMKKQLYFYFFSENADHNFERANNLLEWIKDHGKNEAPPQIELFVQSEEYSGCVLIDSLRYNLLKEKSANTREVERKTVFSGTDVHLIQPIRALCNKLLNDKPLYCAGADQLAVLILGLGHVGKAFLRNAASLNVIHGHQTKFLVWDKTALAQLNQMQTISPDWQFDVNCQAQDVDVATSQFAMLLDQYAETFRYILVALGDDEQNMQTAIQLCRHYRCLRWAADARNVKHFNPVICVCIRDNVKAKLLKDFAQNMEWYANLHVFGQQEQLYSEETLTPFTNWNAAKCVRALIRREDTSKNTYCWLEYERRSSMAAMYHVGSHIYSVVGWPEQEAGFSEAQLQEYESKIKNDILRQHLIVAEHQRWENYVRSEGMRHASLDLVGAYLPVLHLYVDYFAQLTPCITESGSTGRSLLPPEEKITKLEKLYEILQGKYQRFGLNKSNLHRFTENDELLVTHAAKIYRIVKKMDLS